MLGMVARPVGVFSVFLDQDGIWASGAYFEVWHGCRGDFTGVLDQKSKGRIWLKLPPGSSAR